MQSKKDYLDSVCREIRFRAARKYLRSELAAHIDDKAEELKKEGLPDAEQAAVAAMGDAVETGRALNRAHRPRTEWGVIVCVLALSIAGFIIAHAVTSLGEISMSDYVWLNLFPRQIDPTLLGLIIMACICFMDYTHLKKLRFASYAAALSLIVLYMLLNYYIFVGSSVGSHLVSILVLSFLFFPLAMAGFIEENKNRGIKGLAISITLCAVSIAAMYTVLESIYALILILLYIVMLSVSEIQSNSFKNAWKRIFISAAILISFYLLLGFLYGNVLFWRFGNIPNIIWSFGLDTSNMPAVPNMLDKAQLIGPSPEYINHQTWNLGGSQTGHVLTALIGAYGWLAGVGIMLLFAALLAFMIYRVGKIRHSFGKLICSGICAYFVIRFVLCILTNLGLIGSISVDLPFVSYDSLGYFTDSLLIGVFLSVWRSSSFMKDSLVLQSNHFPGAVKT